MADARVLDFHSDACPDNPFVVVSFTGQEAISRLFRFELELVSQRADVDFNALLTQPAHLAIKHGVPVSGSEKRAWETLKIHGVLSSFEQLEKGYWVRYRAVLVPQLWRLSLNVQSQVHMKKSVPQIIETELKKSGFTSDDYEFRWSGAREYKEKEYVVQYIESDLNFIQRLCEHEGIFYFFEHRDGREHVVFGDHPGAFNAIQGQTKIDYRPTGTLGAGIAPDWYEPEVVETFAGRQNVIPSCVILRDYNYRTPTDPLKVELPVDSKAAFGTFYEYGNHYKDTDEGAEYAEIRAQELKCRKLVFQGAGDARAFRAGSIFSLQKHYRGDFNVDYLVTEVKHRASQPVEHAATGSNAPAYRNEFSAIPCTETFRPERLTPKPRVWTLNATVDGPSEDTPQIDAEGRYKVKVPFDLSDLGDGKASRYVRMLTPHAGPGEGSHMPLRKNTEVVLTHMNGDPDRPLIEGAVPNPVTRNPVNSSNHTQFVLQSYSNNKLVFENRKGEERICLESPKWSSFVCIGNKEESGTDGIRACTQKGISLSAGESISIAAGAGTHDTSAEVFSHGAGHVGGKLATLVAVLSAASGLAAEKLASGHTAWSAVAAEAAGIAGGLLNQNVYIGATGKIAAIANAEVVIGAAASVCQVAGGTASMLSVIGCTVGSANTVTIVAGRDVENVSLTKNVKLHAKLKDVKIHAKKNVEIVADVQNVKIEAKKQDLVMEAERNWHVGTHGKAEIMIKKDIYVDSTDDKKIVIKAGKSSITITDDKIQLKADTIEFASNDDGVKVLIGKEGTDKGFAFFVDSKKGAQIVSEGDISVYSKTATHLTGSDKIYLATDELDGTGANKVCWPKHDDSK